MNRQETDMLGWLLRRPFSTQRALAEATGHSLGATNAALRGLVSCGLIDRDMSPTPAARALRNACAPRNAIILAAGMGMRMAPINVTNPKALLEVHGETLIERQIRQLRAAGVFDITVVVGFMKEKFDYLIDAYGVELVVNPGYVHKNNLASLALVADRIANTYIVPCDVWCAESPFSALELGSWYLVSDRVAEGGVRVNRRGELVYVPASSPGNVRVGIAYVLEADAPAFAGRLAALAADAAHDGDYWEEALRQEGRMTLPAKVVAGDGVVEVNTYEQLRDLDGGADRLGEAELGEVASALHADPHEVGDVTLVKKGLVNSTFRLQVGSERYAFRVPSDRAGGTDRWLRERDALVAVAGLGLCEGPLLLDVSSGHKLSRLVEGAHPCDPTDKGDLELALDALRHLHEARLQVPRPIDPFEDIERYERLRGGEASIFRDYAQTKARVMALRPYVRRHAAAACLIHGDPAPENFLIVRGSLPRHASHTEPPRGATFPAGVSAPAGSAPAAPTPAVPKSPTSACPAPSGSAPIGQGPASQTSAGPSPARLAPASQASAPVVHLIDWEYAGLADPHIDVALFCIFSLFDRAQADHLIDRYFAPYGGCGDSTRAKIYCYVAACGLLWSNWCEYEWHRGVEFGEYSLRQYRYAKDFVRYAHELADLGEAGSAGIGAPLAVGHPDGSPAAAARRPRSSHTQHRATPIEATPDEAPPPDQPAPGRATPAIQGARPATQPAMPSQAKGSDAS